MSYFQQKKVIAIFSNKNRKGFTLIEMLVVITIISILVAIVIPVVGNATIRAKAATDAANLRTVFADLNMYVLNGDSSVSEIIDASLNPISKMDPDALLFALHDTPGFIQVFYVNGSTFYSMDYLAELASNGPNSPALAQIGTAKPDHEGVWYQAGVGQVDP